MKSKNLLGALCLTALALLTSGLSSLVTDLGQGAAFAQQPAAVTKTLCVYDPSGTGGDAYQNAVKYQSAAAGWGVKFTLKPYTDEAVAASDFRNKKCDAALITGVRVQQFNRKSYSIEALGLLPSYDLLKKAVLGLSGTSGEALMKSGEFETVGIFPAGAIYLYVSDRSVADVKALAGKKICTMDFDSAAKVMVSRVGAQAVPSDIGTFAAKFNNHGCDVAYAPATAYKPLELFKGVGTTGGVVRFPLAQLTLQLLTRTADMPAGFGAKSRTWASQSFDSFLAISKKAEGGIEAAKWIDIEGEKKAAYLSMIGDARHELVKNGAYDPTVVTAFEKLSGQK